MRFKKETHDADNNYDYGSPFPGENGIWRIVGTTRIGPQAYNTGGEVGLWISRDYGKTWTLERPMTNESEYNHYYPRRTVNAHTDFYAVWADGHGRQNPSSASIFVMKKGMFSACPK